MTLQDQIDGFQKLVFSHFRGGVNNECRISALVPLLQESYGIYKFVTSMLRAMHTSRSIFVFALELEGRCQSELRCVYASIICASGRPADGENGHRSKDVVNNS